MSNPPNSMTPVVYMQLAVMMLLQFMMLAVWFRPLAAYLDNAGVEGTFRALILSAMPLSCLASPIVGMIADRHFAGQHTSVPTPLNLQRQRNRYE